MTVVDTRQVRVGQSQSKVKSSESLNIESKLCCAGGNFARVNPSLGCLLFQITIAVQPHFGNLKIDLISCRPKCRLLLLFFPPTHSLHLCRDHALGEYKGFVVLACYFAAGCHHVSQAWIDFDDIA
jgi:hypothetical protein